MLTSEKNKHDFGEFVAKCADGPSARFLELPASQNIATVNVTYRTMQLEEEREVLNNQ